MRFSSEENILFLWTCQPHVLVPIDVRFGYRIEYKIKQNVGHAEVASHPWSLHELIALIC